MLFKKVILSVVLLASFSCSVFPVVDIYSQEDLILKKLLQHDALKIAYSEIVKSVFQEIINNNFELSEDDIVKVINFAQELHELTLQYPSRHYSGPIKILAIDGQAFKDAHLLIGIIRKASDLESLGYNTFREYSDDRTCYFIIAPGNRIQNIDNSVEDPRSIYRDLKNDIETRYQVVDIQLCKPEERKRRAIAQDVFLEGEKSIDATLLDIVVDLTDGCDGVHIKGIINSIVDLSEEDQIRPTFCLAILKKKLLELDYLVGLLERIEYIDQLLGDDGLKSEELAIIEAKVGAKYPMLSDVCGYEDEKKKLLSILDKREKGSARRSGGLLEGPTDLGKTFIVEAVGNERGYKVVCIDTNELMEDGVLGSPVKKLKAIFKQAIKDAGKGIKVMLFFDEADAMIASDRNNLTEEYRNLRMTFWKWLDKCVDNKNITVMAATNNYDKIPDTITRRLERLTFSYPDANTKKAIMQKVARENGKSISDPLCDEYASDDKTKDWSCGYIDSMVANAAEEEGSEEILKLSLEKAYTEEKNHKARDNWVRKNILTPLYEKPHEVFSHAALSSIGVGASVKGAVVFFESIQEYSAAVEAAKVAVKDVACNPAEIVKLAQAAAEAAVNTLTDQKDIIEKTKDIAIEVVKKVMQDKNVSAEMTKAAATVTLKAVGGSVAVGAILGGKVGYEMSKAYAETPAEGALVGATSGGATGGVLGCAIGGVALICFPGTAPAGAFLLKTSLAGFFGGSVSGGFLGWMAQ